MTWGWQAGGWPWDGEEGGGYAGRRPAGRACAGCRAGLRPSAAAGAA